MIWGLGCVYFYVQLPRMSGRTKGLKREEIVTLQSNILLRKKKNKKRKQLIVF